MGLAFALANHVGDEVIHTMRPGHFGIVTVETVVKKGKEGESDTTYEKTHIRPFSDRDYRKILASHELPCREDGVYYVYEVKGVAEFRSIFQDDAKARALIASRINNAEVDVPDHL